MAEGIRRGWCADQADTLEFIEDGLTAAGWTNPAGDLWVGPEDDEYDNRVCLELLENTTYIGARVGAANDGTNVLQPYVGRGFNWSEGTGNGVGEWFGAFYKHWFFVARANFDNDSDNHSLLAGLCRPVTGWGVQRLVPMMVAANDNLSGSLGHKSGLPPFMDSAQGTLCWRFPSVHGTSKYGRLLGRGYYATNGNWVKATPYALDGRTLHIFTRPLIADPSGQYIHGELRNSIYTEFAGPSTLVDDVMGDVLVLKGTTYVRLPVAQTGLDQKAVWFQADNF